jgi:ribonucleoside-diphosphate reductase alpha chain
VRVLRERYLKRDEQGRVIETPDEMCWRVARAVAEAEKAWTPDAATVEAIAERFYRVMVEHTFLPNSPTLMNAGKGNNLQLSACYVVPVEDSLSGIFDAVKHAALIHKSGGGTGFSFSRLRPQGSIVGSTHGVASGPVSFMKIFDGATEAVRQGGTRRGANMGILRVDHPDILEFIDCKRDGSVTNFNISVAITDEFMRALEADGEYELVDPSTGKVTQRLRARDVMDRIIAAAWATGDPGLVFIDRANASPANPVPDVELLEATNPCVVGETLLATNQGLRRMDALHAAGEKLLVATDARVSEQAQVAVANGGVEAARGVIFHEAAAVFQTGQQVPVWKLTTSHGIEITATPSHRFLTSDGYKRLDELEYGDTLLLQSGEGAWASERALPPIVYGAQSEARLRAKVARGEARPPAEWSAELGEVLGEVLGYVLGDGYVRRSDTADVVGIAVAVADERIVASLRERFGKWFGVEGSVTERQGHFQVQYEGTVATFLMGMGLKPVRAHEKRVPESLFAAPRDAVVGFLRGLFSADGSVQIGATSGSCSVRLATSSKQLALEVQQLLLNLGIVSAMRLRRQEAVRLMPNAQRELAEYTTHAQYEVIIDKVNRDRFAEVVGFLQERKQERLVAWIRGKAKPSYAEAFTTKVALIEDAGLADVYDTTEPVTHSIIVNGLVTHQCGEQYLGPYDACNLGSINLGLFVTRDEAGKAVGVDWAALEETTRVCTRFLDDVIDINPYPLSEVRDKVHANRRIGLGVMGWAELLFELGLRYDSPEATQLGERVMTAIRDWSRDESERLAEVRGPFPNWERSIYKHDKPARNATRTTVAPTGSISILAECSSGIEPLFALAFQHRVKQPDGSYRVLDFVNPFFERALAASDIEDKDAVLAYVKEHGSLHGLYAADHPALRPYVTAHEIAPEWHIRMQGAFQRGVENSISKTINLANSATYDDVRDAYLLAWDLGCLGITIYRDGCKGEQVLNLGVKGTGKDAGKTGGKDATGAPQAKPEDASPAQVTDVGEARIGGGAMEEVDEEQEAATPAVRYSRGVKERPEVVTGYTRQVRAPEGKVNVTLNADTDGLLEIFVNVGKAGSDVAALAEALGRLMSLILQLDSSLSQDDRAREIARQMRSIGGSNSIGFGPERVRSLPDAVARAIECHFSEGYAAAQERSARQGGSAPEAKGHGGNGAHETNGNGSHNPAINPLNMEHYAVTGNLCPSCGNNTMHYEEGCRKCVSCGHSEC